MVRGMNQISLTGYKSEINKKESDLTPDVEPIIKSKLLPCSLPLFKNPIFQ